MNEKQWQQLFDLIDQVVNLEGLTATEKTELVKRKAAEFNASTNVGEFVSYCEDID